MERFAPMESDGFEDASVVLGAGVYALLYEGKVVYVGQSRMLLRRLGQHWHVKGKLREYAPGRGRVRLRFDEVWIRPCQIGELDNIEADMIAKYCPRHNLQPKVGATMPPAVREMIGLVVTKQVIGIDRRGM